MTIEYIILLSLLFFVIAVFYSSAGLGGGSSYLATLALFPIDFIDLRIIALSCNIMVVANACILFYKNDHLKVKKLFPLVVLSVPFAFIGGKIALTHQFFFIILGLTLFIASLIMLTSTEIKLRKLPRFTNAFLGSGIGFLSGLVGIGGGIFLSPLLHISQWSKPKVIAATTSAFILFNSIAGLLGQMTTNKPHFNASLLVALLLAVLIGSQIGSRLTIFKLKPLMVRKVTGVLILLVSIRIIYKYLF